MPMSDPWSSYPFPSMITVDPSTGYLWIADDLTGDVAVVDPSTASFVGYCTWPSTNQYSSWFGTSRPWQIAIYGGYAYVIDYGDSNLVRIDTSSINGNNTCTTDTVPLPLTDDEEQGYGLALYTPASGDTDLYFTLSDDLFVAGTEGDEDWPATTVGYVDLTTWTGTSPTTAVIYTGMDAPLGTNDDFRGIAATTTTSGGLELAFTNLGSVAKLVHL